MTDEAFAMLRVSGFGFAAGIVYWFLGYEPLGTVALLLLGAGPGFAGLVLLQEQRARAAPASRGRTPAPPGRDPAPGPARTQGPGGRGPGGAAAAHHLAAGRLPGPDGRAHRPDLRPVAGHPRPRPARLRRLGLAGQVNRENRYGRVQADTEAPSPAAPRSTSPLRPGGAGAGALLEPPTARHRPAGSSSSSVSTGSRLTVS